MYKETPSARERLALAATHDAAGPLDLHPISPPQSSIFNLSLARPA